MTTLSPEARDALAEFRASLDPAREVADAQWRAVVERVEDDEEDDYAASAREPDGDRTLERGRRRWRLAAVVAVAAGLAIWLGTNVGDRMREADVSTPMQSADRAALPEHGTDAVPAPDPAQGSALDEDDTSSTPAADEAVVEDEVEAEADDVGRDPALAADAAPVAPLALPRARRSKTDEPDAGPLDRLEAEAALVGAARRALGAGEPDRALRLLQTYERRHRKGAMAEEAALLTVRALCDLGDATRASKARAAFLRRYPDSPLRVHLRQDCGT
jgi:hypothetical protein